MNKKIYVVRGSEDGNLGAYSNVKRAHAKALEYLNQNGPVDAKVFFTTSDPQHLREAAATYANVAKKLSDIGYTDIEGESRTSVSIELFYLNQ